ncbi:MAG TPA: ATPase, T2SS/T4P/T4SS family [Verrucomicrobiae bacterium]|nr:ATPase, T2SS/T4P/T4SS family [Verrucomicrobiae bacterium]
MAAPTLPVIDLKGRTIDPAVLKRVSFDTMKRFQVAAFEENEKELKLALVYPEQLKQGFFTALKDMEGKVGRTIRLFRTDPQSFAKVLSSYPHPTPPVPPKAPDIPKKDVPQQVTPQEKPEEKKEEKKQEEPAKRVDVPITSSTSSPATKKGEDATPAPPLFKLGQSVALNYLKRVPLDYAETHRLVSVDFFPPKSYWFVTDGQNMGQTQKLVKEIEKSNDITVHLIKVEEKQLDDLLAYYANKLDEEKKKQEETKRKEQSRMDLKGETQPEEQEVEKVLNADVTVPDVQAAIISTEEEKGGFAGLFQRVAHSFGTGKVEEVVQDSVEEDKEKLEKSAPVEKPKAVAPDTGVSSRSAAAPAEMVKPVTPDASVPAAPAPAPSAHSDEEGDIGKLLEGVVNTVDELKEHVKKGFIPRIVAAVVSYAIHEKASDIHVESFDDEVRVRFRVDGQLMDIIKLPPDVHAAMVSRIKILSRLRLDETRIPQDGRFDVSFNDAQVDLRVSVMPTVHGEKVVMRILDKSKGITSLEKLGIEGLGYQHLMEAIQKPFGVCLATGPTGSGKSTTLYAILNRIATPNVNVVTLEDPVEYEMKGINQAQIRPKIGFTFAEGLRSVLRQDPNIIMVGEIRDGETANMATQAALTGHLVLSTLHTNDAAGAIPRLTNMGIEPFLITSSLNVALGQRLVRKICPHCKKDISLPPGFKAQIEADVAKIAQLNPSDAARLPKEVKFYQGVGCEKCGGKGYLGRMGIYEVLTMTEPISELTLKHAPNSEIQAQSQKEGMLTMYQDGLIKVVNGVTTLDEVLRETSTK